MKKYIIVAILIICAVLAGAYYYFQNRVYEVKIHETQIREKLIEKTPFEKTYLFIFSIRLDNPRVELAQGSEKIAIGVDITLNIVVNNEKKPLGGEIDILSGIRYAADEGAFYLTDLEIVKLNVQGIPQQYTDNVQTIVQKAVTHFLSKYPVYTINSSDIKAATAKLILRAVTIRGETLIISLGI